MRRRKTHERPIFIRLGNLKAFRQIRTSPYIPSTYKDDGVQVAAEGIEDLFLCYSADSLEPTPPLVSFRPLS